MRTPIENGFASIVTPRSMQHRKCVARAVADRQHDVVGSDLRAVRQHNAADVPRSVRPLLDFEIGDLTAKPVFAAQRLDGRAHALDHRHQPERADVRLG